MATQGTIGIDNVAQKIQSAYIGVDGIAREIKKAYIGVNGVARLAFLSSLPPAILDLWSGAGSAANCVVYGGGYYVVGGVAYVSSTNLYVARIAYATSLDGVWTTKDLWTGQSFNININCIKYANGYWMVGGTAPGAEYAACIAYAETPDGNWTKKNLWNGISSARWNNIADITCVDGQWVACGNQYSGGTYYIRIAIATAPDIWATNTAAVSTSDIVTATCIAYSDGYWVIGTSRQIYSHYANIYFATTPITQGWTQKTLWQNTTRADINCIKYANGYWMVGGTGYSNEYTARIAYATSIEGTWTTKDLWSYEVYDTINGIEYADGCWVAAGGTKESGTYKARIAYATTPDGDWTDIDVWNGLNNPSVVNAITYTNGYWMLAGNYYGGASGTFYAKLAYSPTLDGFINI